jgi:predicted flap endonuclease-1-like 5' DNA nuclease
VLLGFYLSYTLFTKTGVDVTAGYAFLAGLPSALTLSAIRFFKSPEYKNKKMKFSGIKKKQNEIKETEKDHKRLVEKRDSYNSEHNSKVSNAESKLNSLRQKEMGEVDKVSTPLKTKIAILNKQSQEANREETEAINRALQGVVQDYISNKLSKHDLASASIQGIGVELKRQLSAHGVKTFGDIIDVSVNYVQHGRFTNSIVQIQVKGRGNVKVPGIGQKKSETLLRYKKSLEQSYLNNAPKTLPSHVLDTIRKPFIIKRNKIDTDVQEAQKLLAQEVNRIHQSYAKQIEDCSKEIIILKSGTEREFKELSWKAEQAEKLTQKRKAEIEQMEKGFKIWGCQVNCVTGIHTGTLSPNRMTN